MKYGIGIDISKTKSTIAILSIEGEIIKEPFEFYHNQKDLNNLDLLLNQFPKEDLKIVMEETGTYHLPILTYLIDKGYCVFAENAFRIKKYLDRGLRKVKTDKKDSLKLAEYACDNWYKLRMPFIENNKYKELRFLSRQYFTFNNIKVQQKVHFSNLTDMLFPGYYQLLDENNYILGLKVFQKYSLETIKNKKQDTFINEIDKIAQKIGHKRAGITFAKKVHELAKQSVPSCPPSEYTQLIIDNCVVALIQTIEATKEIISKMQEIANTLPEYRTVRSMSGAGPRLAPLLIAEIGDIRKFKDSSSLIAYAGIDAPPYQSGQFEALNRHISKRGNKYLRKTGYEIMKAIKSFYNVGNEFYDYMLKKESEGKKKKVAKIATLNKFLRQYYAKLSKLYN